MIAFYKWMEKYKKNRTLIIKLEKQIRIVFKLQEELKKMRKAKIIKPSDEEVERIIEACNELQDSFQEIKTIELTNLKECQDFTNIAFKNAIDTFNTYEKPWYLIPIFGNIPIGEAILIMIVSILISMLFYLFIK